MTNTSVVHIRIDPADIAERATVPELAQVKKALVEGHYVLLAPCSCREPEKTYIMSPAALQRLTDIVLIAGWAVMFAGGSLLLMPEFLLAMPVAACVGAIFGHAMNKLGLKNADRSRS